MKIFKKILKISGIVLGSIVGLALVAVLTLNVAKFAIYSDYYTVKSRIANNPGLNDGAIPQGIASDDEHDFYLTSAYMQNKSHSRIYKVENNKVSHVKLIRNGKTYTGHAGGIGLNKNNIYLANGSKIYTISIADFNSATANQTYLEIGGGVEVNNNASFCSADDEYLYVGEYYDGKGYQTDNNIEYEDKSFHAIMTKYHVDDLTTPIEMFAITNNVQGAVVSPNGDIYLSTSHGLSSSHFYKYLRSENTNSITYKDKLGKTAPLYILDNPTRDIVGPAMAEDLTYKDGKVITLSESACNKYIFGKFFFAYDIVGLNF
jgi:hypothetical protein